MVFVYREHDLRCGGLFSAKNSKFSAFIMSLVVSRLVSWSFLVCDGHVHCPDTADVSVDTALVSVDTSLVS